jgi:chlorophyllide a reductase subunit Y
MQAFFGSVGQGANAGIWQDVPRDRPEFKASYRRRLDKQKRAAEEHG